MSGSGSDWGISEELSAVVENNISMANVDCKDSAVDETTYVMLSVPVRDRVYKIGQHRCRTPMSVGMVKS